MQSNLIDPSLPLEEILKIKERYIAEQIAVLQSEMDYLKSLRLWEAMPNYNPVMVTMDSKPLFTYEGKEWEISQRNVKDIVYGILKANKERPISTSDIYESHLMPLYDQQSRYRKEWIAAISSSLNNLVHNEKVRKYDNASGRGNIYGINDPSVNSLHSAFNNFQNIINDTDIHAD